MTVRAHLWLNFSYPNLMCFDFTSAAQKQIGQLVEIVR